MRRFNGRRIVLPKGVETAARTSSRGKEGERLKEISTPVFGALTIVAAVFYLLLQ
jgi:hypothetical protein